MPPLLTDGQKKGFDSLKQGLESEKVSLEADIAELGAVLEAKQARLAEVDEQLSAFAEIIYPYVAAYESEMKARLADRIL